MGLIWLPKEKKVEVKKPPKEMWFFHIPVETEMELLEGIGDFKNRGMVFVKVEPTRSC